MMRTVAEIKNEMTTAFMADADIKAKYDPTNTWTPTTQFSDVFASSSIESILFYIVAVICYGMEYLFGVHLTEVAAYETRMRVGTKEWWRQLCLSFQLGYSLVFNATTNTFEYSTIDDDAKIITYVDIRELANGLLILVAKSDSNGNPEKLDDVDPTERNAFDAYIKKVKIAGVPLTWNSYDPDQVRITLTVKYDPLVLDSSGQLIGTTTKPVDIAVENYLANIPFGSGILNKTQLIDAIQAAEGVVDVYPDVTSWLEVSTTYIPAYTPVSAQNVTAYGGSFALNTLTVTYSADV